MKYFSIETVVNAYEGFQNCMTNKSWGYLALLKGCKNSIRPSVPNEVDTTIVSNFLEDIFNLSDTKKYYESGRTLYVVFSNQWDRYFNDQGSYSPNIYDVIAWAYRRKAFADNISNEDIIAMFAKEFNIPMNVISNSFNKQPKSLKFSDSLYTESLLKMELADCDVDTSKNNIDAKKGGFAAAPGEISRGPFIQTLYAGLEITDYVLILQSNYFSLYGDREKEIDNNRDEISIKSLQRIFYGAPGTGKSHEIKEQTEGRAVVRTTFHPDSDYSTFVGCYKPSMKSKDRIYSAEELAVKLKEIKNTGVTYPCHKFAAKYWRSLKDLDANCIKQILLACGFTEAYGVEVSKGVAIGQEYLNKEEDGKIIYMFTPQAFTNAYVKAWSTTEDVYLIIEEINRGNCAQIFGDLFQLLDRGDDGNSEYPIDADTDLGNYIAKELESSTRTDFPEGVKDGKKLVLPSNLHIWATMNTSDQSLFPIDSAFKRRWDWKYLPIENAEKGWKIKVNGNEYDWYQFLEAINKEVFDLTHSEDKQLGYFFAKAKGTEIDAETLVNKVYFYLWTDVFKDYDYESQNAFRKPNSNEPIAFKDFFKKGQELDEQMAEQVLINLKLEKLNKPQDLFA
ncbi:hypothetical protein M1D30_07520 [Prevotella sp. E15-22]|uniref:hypothetical protein n=1 Tax=Prevotella sp. E15-22 TaxID=2937774 RepID=UPI00205B0717|nr:hypothetical protein [Prevotella sp. E15-22]UPS43455.1 hypothetical protein M1D30_07520 [Prevotella sp. E15-22]